MKKVDAVIFGAGIAGLWTFNRLKSMGYDVLLLEKDTIGGIQTIAAQGIIHSGLKFTLAGKVNSLAKSISAMPVIWKDALRGKGQIDLSQANINADSQQLLIPAGFMGGLTKLITQKALGNGVRSIKQEDWSSELKSSGFNGSVVFMDEPVLDIPTTIRALAEPYMDCIKKMPESSASDPIEFLREHQIEAKKIIFTSAKSNHQIAKSYHHDTGLETQHRPLLQGMIKNAPFPLFAHCVGKTDKPIATITTHKAADRSLVWYLGGGVAEKRKDEDPQIVFREIVKAFKTYFPNIDFSQCEWAIFPIDRVEGKSKTDNWMPDTPTIHRHENVLYCWPTKLTFAPMLSDMIIDELKNSQISPSNHTSDFSSLTEVEYAKTPWDTDVKWNKWN